MTYDIICLIMILIAFAGGFQNGVVRIFSLLIGFTVSAVITVWSIPYLLDFLKASVGHFPNYVASIIMGFEFLMFSWLLVKLVNILWRPKSKKKKNIYQNVAGGLMLSAIMLFSIAILSGFFEQTKVINNQVKKESFAYKILSPIQKQSKNYGLISPQRLAKLKKVLILRSGKRLDKNFRKFKTNNDYLVYLISL
ncbi:MAG: CvpA family protein [Saprospiraceae bacterium]|nr:CvpA family protein [Saprospiraceae bacterium]